MVSLLFCSGMIHGAADIFLSSIIYHHLFVSTYFYLLSQSPPSTYPLSTYHVLFLSVIYL